MVAVSAGTALTRLSDAPQLIERTGAAARLADILCERITEGGMRPGTRLGEHALAEKLRVSRNTLREAFRLLAHEGLVVHEPHRGVFVRTLGPDDVRDIYATRRLIECAAVRAGASGAAEIRAAVDTATTAAADGRWADVGTADLRFHSAIVALAGSRRLNDMMRKVLAELRLVFHTMADPRRFHEPYVGRNAEIATLIEQGRPEAAATALSTYLDDAEHQLLTGFTEHP